MWDRNFSWSVSNREHWSNFKKDYTLLGDAVNSASCLESHTRRAGYHILFDQRFHKLLKRGNGIEIIKLGKFKPKGKVSKLVIYTIDDPNTAFDYSAKQIARAINTIWLITILYKKRRIIINSD